MIIKLKELKEPKELKEFVRFPFHLYKQNKYWIPPLIRDEIAVLNAKTNPACMHCDYKYIVAIKKDRIVGRIAGIINWKHIELSGKRTARFCWFDSIDDLQVSKTLFDNIENWAIKKEMDGIVGPMGFTTFERQGILVDGYDEIPTIASSYNYSYYSDHIEILGYTKYKDYLEYEIKAPDVVPRKLTRIVGMIEKRYQYSLVKAGSRKDLAPYATQAIQLINVAYQSILGFVPMTQQQIDFFIKKYFPIVHPDFTTLVKNDNNQIVGFLLSMPSLSDAYKKANGRLFPFGLYHILKAIRHPSRIDILLVGVLPEHQNKGVSALFLNELAKACLRRNIGIVESNGLLEENIKIQDFRKYFTCRLHKRRRLYCKSFIEATEC